MNSFLLVTMADMRESLRAKWFILYSLVFGGAIILLFSLGITESQVLGFTGLNRLLITYIQLCIAVLPLFILISTVRAVVGDRESHVMEYSLALPIPLRSYFWGKVTGKFLMVFLPVIVALSGACVWGLAKGLDVAWSKVFYYSILLAMMTWCFIGIGMLISTIAKKQELALGLAFFTWLGLLMFIDIILVGVMLQRQVEETLIVGISLLNPLQVFRTAAILLFDPAGGSIGPGSYVIFDSIGREAFLGFSLVYPLLLGWMFAYIGYRIFRRGDLV